MNHLAHWKIGGCRSRGAPAFENRFGPSLAGFDTRFFDLMSDYLGRIR